MLRDVSVHAINGNALSLSEPLIPQLQVSNSQSGPSMRHGDVSGADVVPQVPSVSLPHFPLNVNGHGPHSSVPSTFLSNAPLSQFGLQRVPVLHAIRALPMRASVLMFTVCRLVALMAALILWCVTLCIAAIGRKLSYDGGGGGACWAGGDFVPLPETCVLWIAKKSFDGVWLYVTASVAALTLGVTVYSFFSLDPRSIVSDREFLRLLFKGWPPGQAVFLSYCWGFDSSKNETPPPSTRIVRAIGEMLPCAYIDVRCFCSGDPLGSEMTRAIQNSAFSIVFLTPKYFASYNCKHELSEIRRLKGTSECAFFVPESCANEVCALPEMQDLISNGFNVFLMPPRYSQNGLRLLLTKLIMTLLSFVLGEEWSFDISPAVVTEMLIACGAAKQLASGSSGRSPSITEHWEGCARCMFSALQSSSVWQRLPKMLLTPFAVEICSLFCMIASLVTQFIMWTTTGSLFFFLTAVSALCLLLVSTFTCTFIWEYMPFPPSWPVIPIILKQKLALRHELWLLCILRNFDCIFRPPRIFLDADFRCFEDEISFLCDDVKSCSRVGAPDFSVNPNTASCINVVSMSTMLNQFAMYFALCNEPSQPLKNTIIFSTTPFSQISKMPQYLSLQTSDPAFETNFRAFGSKVLIDTSMSEGDGFKLSTLLALVIRCGLALPKAGLTPGSLAKSFNLGGSTMSNILAFVLTRWLSYLYILFVVIVTVLIMRFPCLLRFP